MSLLSAGVCKWLNEAHLDELDEPGASYTVQLLSIKKLSHTTRTPSTKERYRVVLSDGVHFIQAMLATTLNDLVVLQEIVKNTIVALDKVTCAFLLRDRRLLIVLELHVVSRDEEKIGCPVVVPIPPAALVRNQACV